MSFDTHKNFAYSTVATAPIPAASGTTLVVNAGDGALFPTPPFNAVVCPAGSAPILTNAEVVRVTGRSTDTFTITRNTEAQTGSTARAIQVGDQIFAAVTAKSFTDIETAVTAVGTPVVQEFRLSLTTVTPVTVTDATAATLLYFTPYVGKRCTVFDSSGVATLLTSAEISIAVPATTATMYDVFVFSNSGVLTLELLAWSSDSARATAIIRTGLADSTGVWTKSGDTTRRYVGSFRTTAVSGQTEDSLTKRYVWNYYNRVPRPLLKPFVTATHAYTLATIRQMDAGNVSDNQVEVVVGVAEVIIDLTMHSVAKNGNSDGTNMFVQIGVGEDSTTTFVTGNQGGGGGPSTTASTPTVANLVATLRKYPAVGKRIYYANQWSQANGTTTWYGTPSGPGGPSGSVNGISGMYLG